MSKRFLIKCDIKELMYSSIAKDKRSDVAFVYL